MRLTLSRFAAAALLMSSAAYADTLPSASFDTFSLQFVSDTLQPGPVTPAFSLLSSTTGQTQIHLDSMDSVSAVFDNGSGPQTGTDDLVIGLQAASGYRITGFSLAGHLLGQLDVGQPASATATVTTTGHADSTANIGMSLFAAGSDATDGARSWNQVQLNNNQAFDFRLENVRDRDNLELHLNTSMYVAAGATAWNDTANNCFDCQSPSYAALDLVDPVLTVYTEAIPVPEPATWAMLAGGLMLVGGAARRRR